MSVLWIGVIGTSLIAFLTKLAGHSIPGKYLSNARVLRINVMIPIALLSALVAVNTLAEKTSLALDHRVAGVGTALIALWFKAPYFVVVAGAAITSALAYRFF